MLRKRLPRRHLHPCPCHRLHRQVRHLHRHLRKPTHSLHPPGLPPFSPSPTPESPPLPTASQSVSRICSNPRVSTCLAQILISCAEFASFIWCSDANLDGRRSQTVAPLHRVLYTRRQGFSIGFPECDRSSYNLYVDAGDGVRLDHRGVTDVLVATRAPEDLFARRTRPLTLSPARPLPEPPRSLPFLFTAGIPPPSPPPSPPPPRHRRPPPPPSPPPRRPPSAATVTAATVATAAPPPPSPPPSPPPPAAAPPPPPSPPPLAAPSGAATGPPRTTCA